MYRRSLVTCVVVGLTAALWLLLVGQGFAASADNVARAPAAAVAFQLDAAHTGVTRDAPTPSPNHRWSVDLGGSVSYPLIVGGLIYVTAADNAGSGTKLYAFNSPDRRARMGTGEARW